MTDTFQSETLQSLISNGKFTEALHLAHKLISDDPSDVVSYIAAADMCIKVGDCQQAIAHYESAIQLDPKGYWAQFNLSRLLVDLAKHDLALQHAETLSHNYPGDYAAVAIRAQIFIATGQNDLAVKLYRDFLNEHARNDMALVSLGDLYQSLRNDYRAIACYEEACTINIDNFWAHRNLGLLLFDLGVYDRAIKSLGLALKVSPNPSYANQLDRAIVSACFYSAEHPLEFQSDFKCTLQSKIEVITNQATFHRAHGALHISISLISIHPIFQHPFEAQLLVSNMSVCCSELIYPTIAVRRQAFVNGWHAVCIRFYELIKECPLTGLVRLKLPDGTDVQTEIQISTIEENHSLPAQFEASAQEIAADFYSRHDFQMAAFFYSRAISDLSPLNTDYFILSLLHAGRYHEAEWQLERLLATSHIDLDCDTHGRLLDMYCYEIARVRLPGYLEKVAAICNEQIKNFGETPFTILNLGHCALEQGKTDLAFSLYQKASKSASGVSLTHFSMGIHSIISEVKGDVSSLTEYTFGECCGLDGIDLVHVFSCDEVYFEKFGPSLILSSTNKSSGNVRIHVHIVGPNESTFRTINRLRDQFVFNFSYEVVPETILQNRSNIRTYFTCARFMIAPKVLLRYRKPILITEADCLMNWDWDDVMEWVVGKADVGIHASGLWSIAPSTKIPAGIMYVDHCEYGNRFIKYAADYISSVLLQKGGSDENLWTLDQVAIWRAWLEYHNLIKIAHLPMYSILELAVGDKSNVLV